MKTIQFKCKLLSDIILSEHSATEGIQQTLDYIPGNVFLGLVAGKIYNEIEPTKAMDLFHAGKVSFGDAHPLINNKRTIRIPASWYLIKGKSFGESTVFIHPNKCDSPTTQCRDKFIFKTDTNQFRSVKQEKNFAIKSAYNKVKRRSMDRQMYGYQSLEAGTELCFQIDYIDSISENLIELVKSSLVGNRTIGRSKTAQYGQVIIEFIEADFKTNFVENQQLLPGCTFLYAESRLLFLDENGQPIIPMNGDDFGMNGAKVDLNRSQIRTFRYSPYNFKRQARDADRFGIEKGSVICIDRAIKDEVLTIKNGIGLFLNEGFGKVLINPEFLKTKDELGEAMFTYQTNYADSDKSAYQEKVNHAMKNVANDPVFLYLKKSKEIKILDQKDYALVCNFIKEYGDLFQIKGDLFASQWGTIRMKALQNQDKATLSDVLFSDKINKEGYLLKGQSAHKWSEKGRLSKLKMFYEKLDDETASKTMVNLAAEMAKICKKGGKNDN